MSAIDDLVAKAAEPIAQEFAAQNLASIPDTSRENVLLSGAVYLAMLQMMDGETPPDTE